MKIINNLIIISFLGLMVPGTGCGGGDGSSGGEGVIGRDEVDENESVVNLLESPYERGAITSNVMEQLRQTIDIVDDELTRNMGNIEGNDYDNYSALVLSLSMLEEDLTGIFEEANAGRRPKVAFDLSANGSTTESIEITKETVDLLEAVFYTHFYNSTAISSSSDIVVDNKSEASDLPKLKSNSTMDSILGSGTIANMCSNTDALGAYIGDAFAVTGPACVGTVLTSIPLLDEAAACGAAAIVFKFGLVNTVIKTLCAALPTRLESLELSVHSEEWIWTRGKQCLKQVTEQNPEPDFASAEVRAVLWNSMSDEVPLDLAVRGFVPSSWFEAFGGASEVAQNMFTGILTELVGDVVSLAGGDSFLGPRTNRLRIDPDKVSWEITPPILEVVFLDDSTANLKSTTGRGNVSIRVSVSDWPGGYVAASNVSSNVVEMLVSGPPEIADMGLPNTLSSYPTRGEMIVHDEDGDFSSIYHSHIEGPELGFLLWSMSNPPPFVDGEQTATLTWEISGPMVTPCSVNKGRIGFSVGDICGNVSPVFEYEFSWTPAPVPFVLEGYCDGAPTGLWLVEDW